MAEDLGGVRPATNGPASASTVAEPTDIDRARRMAAYRRKEHPKYVRALDRHIAHVYGPEYVRRWAA
jgi:hypothetical protein